MNTHSVPPLTEADQDALGRLWEEHRPRLLDFVSRRLDPVLRPAVDPDDVMSQTYIDAQRRWAKHRANPGLSPYAWLYGLVRDRLIETWRHHTRVNRDVHRAMPWPDHSSMQLGLSLIDPGTDPGERAIRDETAQRVRQALDQLTETDREILWMRYYDGLSFAEAGQVLGLSENAATVRHLRALRRLKDLWRQANSESGGGS